jgi:hypothetical protein
MFFCILFIFFLLCSSVWDCLRLKEIRIVLNSKNEATMSLYGASQVATDSLIAQINSRCKLPMQRRKNRKILYENEILEANKLAPEGVVT